MASPSRPSLNDLLNQMEQGEPHAPVLNTDGPGIRQFDPTIDTDTPPESNGLPAGDNPANDLPDPSEEKNTDPVVEPEPPIITVGDAGGREDDGGGRDDDGGGGRDDG